MQASHLRHGRACPGHPRERPGLAQGDQMPGYPETSPGTGPGMTMGGQRYSCVFPGHDNGMFAMSKSTDTVEYNSRCEAVILIVVKDPLLDGVIAGPRPAIEPLDRSGS